jgi:hypothetical protein
MNSITNIESQLPFRPSVALAKLGWIRRRRTQQACHSALLYRMVKATHFRRFTQTWEAST